MRALRELQGTLSHICKRPSGAYGDEGPAHTPEGPRKGRDKAFPPVERAHIQLHTLRGMREDLSSGGRHPGGNIPGQSFIERKRQKEEISETARQAVCALA